MDTTSRNNPAGVTLADAIRVKADAVSGQLDKTLARYTVDTVSPFKVLLNGAAVSVPAVVVGGAPSAELQPGSTGIAILRQGQRPICLPTEPGPLAGAGWQTWTPTYTNITPGNAAVVARYTRMGKLVIGKFSFVAGGTTTYGAGALGILIPVTPLNVGAGDVYGHGLVNNGATASNKQVALTHNAGNFNMQIDGGFVSNTNPFAFGTSSRIGFTFSYEAA